MTFIESETVELKSSVVADICKEVIAFANTKGGTLYIGIEDNGTVVGVDSADRVTLQINNMVRDSIKPCLLYTSFRSRGVTSLGDISHSDGHSVFKVHR